MGKIRIMEAVQRSKARLARYPYHLTVCAVEGGAYATCVLGKENLTKDMCASEFRALIKCMKQSALKSGSRL